VLLKTFNPLLISNVQPNRVPCKWRKLAARENLQILKKHSEIAKKGTARRRKGLKPLKKDNDIEN
jgi:hypothetical protein